MKKISILIAFLIILQSCYSYKNVSYDDIKMNKNYELKLKNGRLISGISEKNTADSLYLRINSTTIKFPKNKIENIKRKKASLTMVIGIVTVFTGGIVFLVNDQQKSTTLTKPY